MSDRKLVVSFGSGEPRPRNAQFATITRVAHMAWDEAARLFTDKPPESEDKSSAGWYAFAEFDPVHRDSENFVARHALTFDYDHITHEDMKKIRESYADLEYVLHTTASHTREKPRLRMVLPLSRPVGFDEFQAISRKVAARAGIELASRETHVAAQMSYLPTVKRGATFHTQRHPGEWLDADAVLGEYDDWTDRTQWPKRTDGDGVHSNDSVQTPPGEKPGIIGEFCRAFDVYAAIERFGLPYTPTVTPGRLTYVGGSRPEGAIVYDDGAKLHSHHDTDPARGQNNAFDLVRLHRFAVLDSDAATRPVTERPSYSAMCELARSQPEIRDALIEAEFEDLGELTAAEQMPSDHTKGGVALAIRICDVFKLRTLPRWLIVDYLERAVIALLVGMRGSFKSFIALDWSMRVAMAIPKDSKEAVYVVSGEGGDFDRRSRAWWKTYGDGREIEALPLYVVERRLDLASPDGIRLIRDDCQLLGISPILFVLDTFSKLSGGLDENDNTAVKQFIGWLDNGLKRKETAFDATVLIVAHTGHSDATRARGASALAADTDAEYIVKRDDRTGAVSVSRERFKASPELGPVTYKPEIVDLDYVGPDNKPVTSLILREATPEETERGREPGGAKAKAMWRVLQDLAPDGQPVAVKAVLDVAVEAEAAPEEGERDRRREKSRIRLENLAAAGFVYFSDAGTMVALSRTKVIPNAEFADVDSYLE